MPTEGEYLEADVGFFEIGTEIRALLDPSRSILMGEPVVGGWLARSVSSSIDRLHESSRVLAAQCVAASDVARDRALMIRTWRTEEQNFRAAYEAWRRACHEVEIQADLALAEFGVPIDPNYPPEPVGRPSPAPWADLELPPFS